MAQALKKLVPSPTAAQMAAFTTVAKAPELHRFAFDGPEPEYFDRGEPEYSADVVYPQWWRHPAIVLRGWRPRLIESRSPVGDRIAAAAVAAFAQLREWRERVRSRHALLRLDDRMLSDLGIDRATAQFLGTRPFWRADD
jgi:uncharacterized protein YjiS (DUF1127 family)